MKEKLIAEMAKIGWELKSKQEIMKDLESIIFVKDDRQETVIVDSKNDIMIIEKEMLSGATKKEQINLRGQIITFDRCLEGRYTHVDEILLYFIAKSPDGAII